MIGHWNGPLTTHANRVLIPGRDVEIDEPGQALKFAALGYFKTKEPVQLLHTPTAPTLETGAHEGQGSGGDRDPVGTAPGARANGGERRPGTAGGSGGDSFGGRRPREVPHPENIGELPAHAQSEQNHNRNRQHRRSE